jgi:hypothetical protein
MVYRKGEPGKLELACDLPANRTMPLAWIAERLHMLRNTARNASRLTLHALDLIFCSWVTLWPSICPNRRFYAKTAYYGVAKSKAPFNQWSGSADPSQDENDAFRNCVRILMAVGSFHVARLFRANDMAHVIISNERRAWMRLASHTVVFDREHDFLRFSEDPSGSVIRILHLWLAEPPLDVPTIRHYLGSVRRCDSGGWVSRRQVVQLFRCATAAAVLAGENSRRLRHALSRYLRKYFSHADEPDA